MRIRQKMLHTALLGSALAAIALTPAAAASLSYAEKRALAESGRHSTISLVAHTAHTGSAFTVMHDFTGPPSDGASSTAEVTLDKAGNIYGTTDYGGANGAGGDGTIFKVATDGTESLVHSFGGSGDGSEPDAAVTIEANGDMYGTTSYGGTTENGVIWKLAADGTYTVLHNFSTDEGSGARGGLIQDKKGNFYGTCLFSGANNDGTVFEFSAKGKLTVLHTFDGDDGAFPEHGVVMDKAGNLYGVTAFGGATDNGSVYKIAKDGTFSTLYSFTGGADGGFLYGGLAIDKKGNLYGSADDGGANSDGTVFKLSPGGTLTVLYDFTGGADGSFPEGDMLLVGKNLYSTTTSGGANGEGGVYEVTPNGKEKTLADFSDSNGNVYSAGLTLGKKKLYGTTEYGGPDDDGTVFSVKKK